MAPLPKFADFGKGFSDELLSKDDFPVGAFNVKVNTTSASRVKFTVSGGQQLGGGLVTGSIKAKSTYKDITFTETVTLPKKDGDLPRIGLQTEYKNALNVVGLKVETDSSLAVGNLKEYSSGLTLGYTKDVAHVQTTIRPFERKGDGKTDLTVEASAVAGSNNMFAGTQLAYSRDSGAITAASFGATFVQPDFDVTLFAKRFSKGKDSAATYEYSGSFSHDVLKDNSVRVGAQVTHRHGADGKNDTSFDLAAKYRLDSFSTVRARVNKAGVITLSFAHLIRPDVKFTVVTESSAKLDKTQLGFALTFGN